MPNRLSENLNMSKIILILCAVTLFFIAAFFAYFQTGMPQADCDYVAKMNATNSKGVDPSLNAAVVYQKAINKFVNIHDSKEQSETSPLYYTMSYDELLSLPPNRYNLLLENIKDNQDTITLYKKAAQMPYYYRERKSNSGLLDGIILSEIGQMRIVCFMISLRGHINFKSGNYDEALEDYLSVIKTAYLLCSEKSTFFIEQMSGVSIAALGYKNIAALLPKANFNDDQLKHIKSFIKTPFIGNSNFQAAMECEQWAIMDIIQHAYTKQTSGRGHFSPSGIYLIDNSMSKLTFGTFAAIFLEKRNEVEQMLERRFAYYKKYFDTLPWDSKDTSAPSDCNYNSMSSWYQLKYLLLTTHEPSFEDISKISFTFQNDYGAILCMIGLHQYKFQYSKFPEKLEELVEKGILDALPRDVFGPGVLIYRRNGEDFSLYSYGKDFDDDNGRRNGEVECEMKNSESSQKSIYNGDDVFWPQK